MSFYDLDLFFNSFEEIYGAEKRPIFFCLAWEGVPYENLEIMLNHKAEIIMFDLRSEEEFSFCRNAVLEGKPFQSQGTSG